MKNKIKVHLADDHQIIIDGLKAVLELENDIEVVGNSDNGEEVIEWFHSNQADVLLLDMNMPKLAGIDVLKEFKKSNTMPRVIMLSSHDDVKSIKDVLGMGVKGFVPKVSTGEHIVKAIKAVHDGGQYFTEDIKDKMIGAFTGEAQPEQNKFEETLVSSLTKRELEILKLIAQEHTTKEIAEKLFLSPSTIETHRKNLIKKVHAKGSIELALFAVKNDIV